MNRSQKRLSAAASLWVALLIYSSFAHGQAQETANDFDVDDRRLPTGQVIRPAGNSLTFAGRPNDLCYSASRDLLFVKSHRDLKIISCADWSILQTLPCPGGASLTGLVVDPQGNVYLSNAANLIHVFSPVEDETQPRQYALHHSLELPSDCFPCGLCLAPNADKLYACLSKKNSVAVIDLASKSVEQTIDVGIAPFDVLYVAGSPNRLFVSNLGGRRAEQGERTAPSAGTETPVDDRGIASTSLVSVIDLDAMTVIAGVPAGLHPTALAFLPAATDSQAARIVVANANDDSVTLIEENSLESSTQLTKPIPELPFGSMPNSICLSGDGQFLFVGLAGNNAISVYALGGEAGSARAESDASPHAAGGIGVPLGFIPTAWYPVALACSETELYIANLKGLGSRADSRSAEAGRNSHDHLGSIQKVALSDLRPGPLLSQWTEQVLESAQVLSQARMEAGQIDMPPQPIPQRLGAPSTFKHVIYVIKENRTYDQVFGDMPEGRGDKSLCIFPEEYTPNHHALARRFGLLDNYYCNGVLSADGHSWATEANVTPYLERAFGGFARSYTFGDDPLTYSSSGFLWDHVLAAGLSFRNYGEMDYAKPPEGMKYQEIWNAFQQAEPIQFEQEIGIERLRRYSCREYPGWNMTIPDVLRMDRFLKEFREFEENGNLPNLCIVYLPQDHLGGGVTSAAHMADNDLALGQLVDAVSHSAYWADTLIIANEDDPQNGFDHIDGHRSLCLVISAYSKPGVNHSFYNQTSVIRTILHTLGLPPMNQQDARSPLMRDCFVDTPSQGPFNAIAANFPLNQTPNAEAKQSAQERHWRSILASVPIERTGMKTERDEDHLNRFIWHDMRGWDTPYPARWAGSHGSGLAKLGLKVD